MERPPRVALGSRRLEPGRHLDGPHYLVLGMVGCAIAADAKLALASSLAVRNKDAWVHPLEAATLVGPLLCPGLISPLKPISSINET